MKTILSICLVFFTVSASSGPDDLKSSKINLRSSEEFVFYDKKDLLAADMGKIAQFRGVLIRPQEASSALKSSDLYQFPKETRIKMNLKICREYVTRILGKAQARGLKEDYPVELFETSVGPACFLEQANLVQDSSNPNRVVILGFIHGQLNAQVWNLPSKLTDESRDQLKGFWKTLK